MKDKIIEILKSMKHVNFDDPVYPEDVEKYLKKCANEIDSIYQAKSKEKAMSKEEIDKLWKRFSFESETVDDDGEFTGHEIRLMTKPEFELAIKELNNNQP